MDTSKDLARALRRHHAFRLRKAREGYWGRRLRGEPPLDERQLGMLVNTAALCSCFACCNPRRIGEAHWKDVRDEQHALDELLRDA